MCLFQMFLAAGHEKVADVVVAAKDAVWLFANLPAAEGRGRRGRGAQAEVEVQIVPLGE
jgi:hypothetical protein